MKGIIKIICWVLILILFFIFESMLLYFTTDKDFFVILFTVIDSILLLFFILDSFLFPYSSIELIEKDTNLIERLKYKYFNKRLKEPKYFLKENKVYKQTNKRELPILDREFEDSLEALEYIQERKKYTLSKNLKDYYID